MNSAYSQSKFYKKKGDLFLDLNNDINRIASALNNYKDENGIYVIKRLVASINSNPIDDETINYDKYIDWDITCGETLLSKAKELNGDGRRVAEAEANLVDKLICRTPMIPSRDNSREMGSYITINLLEDDLSAGKNFSQTTVSIDVWTPPQQWIIDNGLRPYLLCSYVDKVMTNIFRQDNGVKYRLVQVINVKLSDDLLGFRLVYETILEN